MANRRAKSAEKPASAYQLWRLNRLGRLRIVDEAQPLSSREAYTVIRAELEKLGEPHFHDTRAARAAKAPMP
jgi:hypothetical protein